MFILTHPVQLVPEEIVEETLHDHHSYISICERPVCDLRFVDDIDLMGVSNGELQDLTNRLVDRAAAYEIEAQKDHVQQHEQHQCRYWHVRPEVRGGDQFKVPGTQPRARMAPAQ